MKKQRYQVNVCVTVSPDQKTITIDFAYCQCPIEYVKFMLSFFLVVMCHTS